MLYDLRYKLDQEGIKIMAGCAVNHIIQEIHDAVQEAYREITITVDHDPDWGFTKIVAVNNHELRDD